MKVIKKIIIFLLCICLLSNFSVLNVEAKTNVKLSKTKITLTVGKTSTLKLEGGKVKKWSTSNKKIVTVSSKGKITAIKTGSVTIKALSTDGKSYKCMVTVKKNPNATYSASEVINIIESTLRNAGLKKPEEIMTSEELEEFGSTAGMGWVEFSISDSNPQSDANRVLEFYTTNGKNLYYLEYVGSISGEITIRAYNGSY